MIQSKPKKCNGTGKAKGYGCGQIDNHRILGLGTHCGCYQNWMLNTPEGNERLKKAQLTGRKKVEKEKKKKAKAEKEKLIDYSEKLQDKVNEIVRLIDIGLPCLARGYHPNQTHAGHIYSRGSNSTMRYNLHNIHRQSAQSNHFQNEDGLLREGLINEYGQDYFDFIGQMRQIKALKYSNDEYQLFYKKACKIALELKKQGKRYDLKERIKMRNKINLELGIYELFCTFTV